jgi:hypothetical protein
VTTKQLHFWSPDIAFVLMTYPHKVCDLNVACSSQDFIFLSKCLPDYMNCMFQPLGAFIIILTTTLPYYPLTMFSFNPLNTELNPICQ